MSGAGENRWRRPNQSNGNGRQNSTPDTRGSGSNTPTNNGAQARTQGSMAGMSGNVWGAGAKAKIAGGAGQQYGQSQSQGQGQGQVQGQGQGQGQAQAQIGSGFNATEAREFLKRSYQDALKSKPDAHYKPKGDSVEKRGNGVWGSRGNMPNQMPNGQDFLQQLSKQLAARDAK